MPCKTATDTPLKLQLHDKLDKYEYRNGVLTKEVASTNRQPEGPKKTRLPRLVSGKGKLMRQSGEHLKQSQKFKDYE